MTISTTLTGWSSREELLVDQVQQEVHVDFGGPIEEGDMRDLVELGFQQIFQSEVHGPRLGSVHRSRERERGVPCLRDSEGHLAPTSERKGGWQKIRQLKGEHRGQALKVKRGNELVLRDVSELYKDTFREKLVCSEDSRFCQGWRQRFALVVKSEPPALSRLLIGEAALHVVYINLPLGLQRFLFLLELPQALLQTLHLNPALLLALDFIPNILRNHVQDILKR